MHFLANVLALSAGTTDSALTNHGLLQANRLGSYLAEKNLKIAHIFSSDLQRAFKTAEAIRMAQSPTPPATTKLELLREQYFGFYEGKQFFERPKEGTKSGREAHLEAHRNEEGFVDVESKESMRIRANSFIDSHLLGLLGEAHKDHGIAVVAHGIFLSHLWRAILRRFHPANIVVSGVQEAEREFSLEYLGNWSNTGYLDLEIKPDAIVAVEYSTPPTVIECATSVETPPGPAQRHSLSTSNESSNLDPSSTTQASPGSATLQQSAPISPTAAEIPPIPKLLNLSLVVKAVNSQEHLKGLKKTRGGIGNLKHDESQKTVDSFFKKRRIE
jgi:broad specificity phosphatase PhoE